MRYLILGLLLMGAVQAMGQDMESVSVTIEMTSTISSLYTVPVPLTEYKNISLSASTSNDKIVTVQVPVFNEKDVQNGFWNATFNITAVFLGYAEVSVNATVDGMVERMSIFKVTVIRPQRPIDIIFTASVAILVSILYINFGCAMDWEICRKTLRKPIGPTIGFITQFLFMPVISYVVGYFLFPDNHEMQLGMFFTGVSPSGGASNIWTLLLGGNINLSITMTTICTIAAFGMMPLWIFTLGRRIFERAHLVVPYSRIAMFAIALVLPLAIGYFIQKKLPRLSRLMVRIMKPFSAILIIFIVVFAIITNLYLFQLFSWQIIVAGMGLPWLGYIFGYLVSLVMRQPTPDTRAISIETGIQNTGIAIFLLRFSLDQPAADLTTVVPVSCAIMTPLPLILLYIVRLVVNRRQKEELHYSKEKLEDNDKPVPTISNSDASTVHNPMLQ
ncbi:P3 protein [Orussus abietinus]|uniref:P3 protein n=1 Tax=Orussus abietinus TaxID=222816 RepID=UPI000626723F|nr:P3 protein [Orussus abietinus]XP_012282663.1 P3 protein [Orussus abietinus]XP_012282664.1 P3 protein [Orussus abietinus]